MSKETYMTGFNKMASACGVDAKKLLYILGGNRRGGTYSIKSAQDGSSSKGFLANLGEAISSKWNGLTDNEKTLALGLAGAGGGGLLGAGVGKLTGFGAGKGAITGALLGGMGGAGYGMYSKERNKLLGDIASQKKDHESIVENLKKTHAGELDKLNKTHADEVAGIRSQYDSKITDLNKTHADDVAGIRSQYDSKITDLNKTHADDVAGLRAQIAAKEKELSDAARTAAGAAKGFAEARAAEVAGLKEQHASEKSQLQSKIDQMGQEAEKARKTIAKRDGTINTLRSLPSITDEEYVKMSPEERKNVNSSMDWFIDKYTARKDELKWAAIKDKKIKELAAAGYTPEQINAMLANSRPDTIEWNIANFNDKLDALREQDRKINDKNSAEAQKLREAIEKYEALIKAYQELGSKRSNMAGNAVPSPGNAKKIGR